MPTIALTSDQGSSVMMFIENLKFPVDAAKQAKGIKEFSPSFASAVDHKIGQLRKQLNKASPIVEETGRLMFGKKDAYLETKPTEEELKKDPDAVSKYKIKDRKVTTDVELTGDEARGLFWALYLTLLPTEQGKEASHAQRDLRYPIALQHDVSWPVLEKLGRVSEMKEKLGFLNTAEVDPIGKSDKEIAEEAELQAKRKLEEEAKGKDKVAA